MADSLHLHRHWTDLSQLKKALTCGTFISILEGSLKSQAVSFAIPVAAVLPWSDSILQEYKSGFLKEILPRTTRRQYVEGKVFSIMVSGFMVWTLSILTVFLSILLCSIRWRYRVLFRKKHFWTCS